MEQLIPIINKLQDVFNAIGQSPIDLPQIVVVGGQSSGKSSVLEKIVGRDFLPRGTGIVTRRPLVLQLYNVPSIRSKSSDDDDEMNPLEHEQDKTKIDKVNKEKNSEEWGEFLHIPGKKFTDFDEIRNEIAKETERLTGSNKGVSNRSINLKICSPHVLNLTLVDLPGITKVPVGDQPVNIEEQIHEMCLSFIRNPNSIILAVTAANTDLANSDALKIARSVDGEGLRTIGVLTKLDLMDHGTDAVDMLQGRIIPLKKGYVGVVNRSQADINNNSRIRESLTKEQHFFTTHSAYRGMSSRMGTAYLSKTLNTILMHHIRDCLPDIKSRINSMLIDLDAEMEDIGAPTMSMSTTNLGATLLRLLSHFASNFADSLEGRHHALSGVELNELYGGARINYIFNETFAKSIQNVDPFDGLSDNDIRTAIRNANGARHSLFVPEVSFELLVKRQIARLEQPGLQCVDLVFDELQRVTSQCETMELTRFTDLRENVVDVVNRMLRKCVSPTQGMISNLIKVELAYINTSHPDFIGGSRAVAQLMERLQREKQNDVHAIYPPRTTTTTTTTTITSSTGKSQSGLAAPATFMEEYRSDGKSSSHVMSTIFASHKKVHAMDEKTSPSSSSVVKLPPVPVSMRQLEEPTDRERIETEIIKALMASYFDIVRKNFMDMVPKTIMCFLVNHCKENVQNELVSNLYKEEKLGDLLRETDDIAGRRANCVEMRTLLKRALEIVNEVRDFNTFK